MDQAKRDEQARALCLRLLTARARTRSELEAQLAKRGYTDDVSGRVLDRLAVVGLVDDADFAEQWVRSRRANAEKASARWPPSSAPRASTTRSSARRSPASTPAAERQRAEELVREQTATGTRWTTATGQGDAQAGRDAGARGYSTVWPLTWSTEGVAELAIGRSGFCIPSSPTRSHTIQRVY